MEDAELPGVGDADGGPVAGVVDLLRRAGDALQGLDLEAMTGRELGALLVEVHRQEARLLAGKLAAVRAFDQRPYWKVQGATSAARWLTRETRASVVTMQRLTRLGRLLPDMPLTRDALAAGDICGDHVEVIAKPAGSRRPAVAEAFGDAEETFVQNATERQFEDFADVVKIWQIHVDQDGANQKAGADHDDRHLHLSQTFRGNWVLRGQLDPIAGEEVNEALQRIYDELFKADWAQAQAVHGDDTRVEHLARTPAQRRADALQEMARRAVTAPADGKRPRPLFVAHLGMESLKQLCETATGTPIVPGQLVPLISDADIERIVYEGESRKIIDLGKPTRFFKGPLRRAIQHRDRQCVEPGCRVPAARCEVDHIKPDCLGGETTQENGQCRCRPCHRKKSKHDGSHPPPPAPETPPDTS